MGEQARTGALRRVVVTGVGAVSPLGVCVEALWEGLCAGRSGIGPITQFDTTGYETTIAGEVRGFDPEAYLEKKEARRPTASCSSRWPPAGWRSRTRGSRSPSRSPTSSAASSAPASAA